TQDDAHIICTPDQAEDEILRVLKFSLELLRVFGFEDIRAFLSTRPEKAVGEQKRWDFAQEVLERAIKKEGIDYELDEGGGAFYGPKIDLKIKDALGREWQLSTIQFDFNLPERFEMTFVGEDGKGHQPYMVHRALLGSIERFFGILVEHYAGHFPLWLAPVQVAILPVADVHEEYTEKVESVLKENGIRTLVLNPSDSLGKRIRTGEKNRIPYLLVLGDTEKVGLSVSVRNVRSKNQETVSLEDFVSKTVEDIKSRSLEHSFAK
ncbi:MAG: threonine--tRNA ligase, partial [Candidatus Peribacteraceae bacterium]|nr:threonine--tRNA ligase [Candidatus Peribacteraceae bacterium]